jgi:hypothetical protein
MSANYWNDEAQPATDAQRAAAEAIMNDALETWRDRALKDHPGAAPLREYLTAETAEGVKALAADLEAKIGPTQPAQPTPTVGAGSPALPPSADDNPLSEAAEALRRNPNSNEAQSNWLREKFHDAGMLYPGEE